MIDRAGAARKIVEELKETEARSGGRSRAQPARRRTPTPFRSDQRSSAQSRMTVINCPFRALVEAERVLVAQGSTAASWVLSGMRRPYLHRRPHGAPRPGGDFRRRSRYADPRRAIAPRHLPTQPRVDTSSTGDGPTPAVPIIAIGSWSAAEGSQRSGRALSLVDRR